MASAWSSTDSAGKPAPRYQIPDRVAMSVEHPCIVKNVDRALEMIGGPSTIAQSLKGGSEVPLYLRFRPDDPTSRPVVSIPKSTNNILLRVTVPKRTGCKRKRGSSGPFFESLDDRALPRDTRYLLRSMQDNPDSYAVEPLSTVCSTHVWRSIPDFVYSTENSEFLAEIREKVLSKSYPSMKQYRMPQTYGLTNTEVLPPPQLSSHTIASNYSYRANPQIQVYTDPVTGQQSLYHGTEARKKHTLSIQWYSNVPTRPPLTIPALSTQGPIYQSVVTILQEIFSRRPIWTRRALINQLPLNISLQTARTALSHVAFNLRSGPWRDTVCAFGINPRSDPKYRIYQSVMIQLVRKQGKADSPSDDDEDNPWDASRSWKRSDDTTSHIFTGAGEIPPDGKIWQVCDIVDPQLAAVVNLDESVVDMQCESRTRGFYPAGAWAKLKVALKYKIAALQKSRLDEYSSAIDNLLGLPDVWDGSGTEANSVAGRVNGGYLASELKGPELHWAAIWRATVRAMLGKEMVKGKGPAGNRGKAGEGDVATGQAVRDDGAAGSPRAHEIADPEEVVDDDGNVFTGEEEGGSESGGDDEEDVEDEDLNISDDDVDE